MKKIIFAVGAVVASLAAPAFAADLPVKAPPLAPIVAAPFWTGFYAGVNVGYSWGKADSEARLNGALIFTDSLDVNGVIGGGQIGYNWQTGNFVLGVEADFQGSGQKGDKTSTFSFVVPGIGTLVETAPYENKLTYLGTVRGRLGYAFSNWLIYATGGWAYGHEELEGVATIGAVTAPFSFSTNRSGWTAGAGVEMAFNRNWSWKAEYLHVDLGDWNIVSSSALGTSIQTVNFTDNIVRLGVNYRF